MHSRTEEEDAASIPIGSTSATTRTRKSELAEHLTGGRRMLAGRHATGIKLTAGIRNHDNSSASQVFHGFGTAMRLASDPKPNLSRLVRAPPLSAQRTRFQLRRPSVSEEGVCCKPELGGALRWLLNALPTLVAVARDRGDGVTRRTTASS